MLPAGLTLLTGLDAGLVLLGVPAPVRTDRLPEVHGMLLVLGFVGTLVALERAVALRRGWGALAPAGLGLGALAALSPLPLTVGKLLLVAGTAALVAVYLPLWRRQRDDAVLVQTLGAVFALGAAVLWWGGTDVPVLLPWLAAFVILTIAGERLELARISMGSGAGTQLLLLSAGLSAGVVAALLWPRAGLPLLGLTLLALTTWLATYDIARRTVRATGAPRFAAGAMLLGYGWLGVAGGVWLLAANDTQRGYDAVVHAVFLGFTMSMIIAHAPTILPAVLRRPLPFHPAMWAPLALLHAGLVVRSWLGDGHGSTRAWQVGGVLNVVALLLFAGVTLVVLTRRALTLRTRRAS
jgi:hypothetical protein